MGPFAGLVYKSDMFPVAMNSNLSEPPLNLDPRFLSPSPVTTLKPAAEEVSTKMAMATNSLSSGPKSPPRRSRKSHRNEKRCDVCRSRKVRVRKSCAPGRLLAFFSFLSLIAYAIFRKQCRFIGQKYVCDGCQMLGVPSRQDKPRRKRDPYGR